MILIDTPVLNSFYKYTPIYHNINSFFNYFFVNNVLQITNVNFNNFEYFVKQSDAFKNHHIYYFEILKEGFSYKDYVLYGPSILGNFLRNYTFCQTFIEIDKKLLNNFYISRNRGGVKSILYIHKILDYNYISNNLWFFRNVDSPLKYYNYNMYNSNLYKYNKILNYKDWKNCFYLTNESSKSILADLSKKRIYEVLTINLLLIIPILVMK